MAAIETVKAWLGYKSSEKQALVQDHISDNQKFALQAEAEDKKEVAIARVNKNNILLKDFSIFALTAVIIFAGLKPCYAFAFFQNIIYAVPQEVLRSYWCMFGALWGFNLWSKR